MSFPETVFMPLKFPKVHGTLPDKLLSERSKMGWYWRFDSSHGISPTNSLDRKLNILNHGMLSPIQEGMVPVKFLWRRSRLSMDSDSAELGSCPERLLLLKSNNWRSLKKVFDIGNSLKKLLLAKLMNCSMGKLSQQLRIFPEKWFLERSRGIKTTG